MKYSIKLSILCLMVAGLSSNLFGMSTRDIQRVYREEQQKKSVVTVEQAEETLQTIAKDIAGVATKDLSPESATLILNDANKKLETLQENGIQSEGFITKWLINPSKGVYQKTVTAMACLTNKIASLFMSKAVIMPLEKFNGQLDTIAESTQGMQESAIELRAAMGIQKSKEDIHSLQVTFNKAVTQILTSDENAFFSTEYLQLPDNLEKIIGSLNPHTLSATDEEGIEKFKTTMRATVNKVADLWGYLRCLAYYPNKDDAMKYWADQEGAATATATYYIKNMQMLLANIVQPVANSMAILVGAAEAEQDTDRTLVTSLFTEQEIIKTFNDDYDKIMKFAQPFKRGFWTTRKVVAICAVAAAAAGVTLWCSRNPESANAALAYFDKPKQYINDISSKFGSKIAGAYSDTTVYLGNKWTDYAPEFMQNAIKKSRNLLGSLSFGGWVPWGTKVQEMADKIEEQRKDNEKKEESTEKEPTEEESPEEVTNDENADIENSTPAKEQSGEDQSGDEQ